MYSKLFTITLNRLFLQPTWSQHRLVKMDGGLAQLARAFAWHAKGHRFDSGNLHQPLRPDRFGPYSFVYFFKGQSDPERFVESIPQLINAVSTKMISGIDSGHIPLRRISTIKPRHGFYHLFVS